MSGILLGIYVCSAAGEPMQHLEEVEVIAGKGLRGDRYSEAAGSWNKGELGKRQVTLINNRFFRGTSFTPWESRRNLVVNGIELMWHIDREFQIGRVRFRGVKYCDPCERPANLAGKKRSFRTEFFDCAGLIAEVTIGGLLRVGDPIIPARRNGQFGSVEEEFLNTIT